MKRESANSALQNSGRSARRENHTGIPTQLMERMEQSIGLSFDDVRVHYNSALPARLGALAYTQGNQVEIGPGQERHLPHELGHVVQQKLGTVRANAVHSSGVPMNTDAGLERQAGEIEVGKQNIAYNISTPPDRKSNPSTPVSHGIVQRVIILRKEKKQINKSFCQKKNNASFMLDYFWAKVKEYATGNNLDAIQLERVIRGMIKQQNTEEFEDISALIKAALPRVQAKEEKNSQTKNLIAGFQSLYDMLEERMKNDTIMELMTNMDLKQFGEHMLGFLKEKRLEIPLDENGIVMNYKSSQSSIAGTVTYEYNGNGIRFFIEIHPKGGIHYGAYFLMKFSSPTSKSSVKYVFSKPSTYLPKGERRTLIFRHKDEPLDSKFMEDMEKIDVGRKSSENCWRGSDTPNAILEMPICNIFRIRTMVDREIWSPATVDSVVSQRNEICEARDKMRTTRKPEMLLPPQ